MYVLELSLVVCEINISENHRSEINSLIMKMHLNSLPSNNAMNILKKTEICRKN